MSVTAEWQQTLEANPEYNEEIAHVRLQDLEPDKDVASASDDDSSSGDEVDMENIQVDKQNGLSLMGRLPGQCGARVERRGRLLSL